MLWLGHMGVGLAFSRTLRPQTLILWTLLGTLLPDFLDKSVYYGLSLITGRTGADIGLISCTRTFGHTFLFFLLFFIPAWCVRSRRAREILFSLSIGICSHHLLDFVQDATMSTKPFLDGAERLAFFFPFYRPYFATMPTHSALEHLSSFLQWPALFLVEALGLGILVWFWKKRDLKTAVTGLRHRDRMQ